MRRMRIKIMKSMRIRMMRRMRILNNEKDED